MGLTTLRHKIIIASQQHIDTVSSGNTGDGTNVARFSTDLSTNVLELKVSFSPAQSGSGTPSPSNVRPISGYANITVKIAGADLINAQTISTMLPDTIYGGYFDVLTGLLTVTHAQTKISQLSGWGQHNNTASRQAWKTQRIDIKPSSRSVPVNCISDTFKPVSYNSTWTPWVITQGNTDGGGVLICVPSSSYSTATQMAEDLGDVVICYELNTPQTYQLSSHAIKTLRGINNIWCEQGTVEIKCWVH